MKQEVIYGIWLHKAKVRNALETMLKKVCLIVNRTQLRVSQQIVENTLKDIGRFKTLMLL